MGHIAAECAAGRADNGRHGALSIPNLTRLGLAHACAEACGSFPAGLDASVVPQAAYGYAQEISSGKDTPSGHWEMAGSPVLFDWGYFSDKEQSFPPALLESLVTKGNLPGYLGNCHSSGTVILDELGEEIPLAFVQRAHLRDGGHQAVIDDRGGCPSLFECRIEQSEDELARTAEASGATKP